MGQQYDNDLGTLTIGEDGVAELRMQMAGRVNKINEVFIRGFAEHVERLAAMEGLKGVLLTSGHRDFCVGADLDFIFQERDPAVILEGVGAMNRANRQLETLGVPVVAVLTGTALGGGYETAMATHHRVAVDDARILFGLPEVQLGVIPGGGGTQRLPRMVGIQAALELIGLAKQVRAPKALGQGLVDALAPDAEAARAAALAWIEANPKAAQPWDQKGFRMQPRPDSGMARNLFMGAAAMLYKKTSGAYRAPEAAITVIQEGARLTFDRALEVELRAFARLATGDQAKDMMRTIWFSRHAAERMVGLPRLDKGEDAGIQKVAILGAGMMGAGLAFVSAKAGYDVVLKDISAEALEQGMAHCAKQAGKLRHLDKDAQQAILARITGTLDDADVAGSDLVIEAVVENPKVKHAVLTALEPHLAPDAIWASNTSALPIADLAEPSQARDRFIGLHFFSPVEKMPLIEVITTGDTSERTVARCLDYAKRIKKTPIIVGDGYGFFTSRVFAAYIMEGVQLLAEGHAPALIEQAARKAGMVVPPLQVFDEVTLSLGRHVLEQSEQYTGAVLPEAKAVLVAMVDQHGRKGRAAGAGFYTYEGGRRAGLWSGLGEMLDGAIGADRPTGSASVDELAERFLLVQAVESVRTREAGVLTRPQDGDVGAILGIGYAPNTGGPFVYLDRMGIPAAVARLDTLADAHGERYRAPALLRDMAGAGETFYPVV
jgi:3-hydroxyacyl-CoA dehydrogenase/enoyl-CoA hydratase/3-hydroxybutyryl-CoA epimerase